MLGVWLRSPGRCPTPGVAHPGRRGSPRYGDPRARDGVPHCAGGRGRYRAGSVPGGDAGFSAARTPRGLDGGVPRSPQCPPTVPRGRWGAVGRRPRGQCRRAPWRVTVERQQHGQTHAARSARASQTRRGGGRLHPSAWSRVGVRVVVVVAVTTRARGRSTGRRRSPRPRARGAAAGGTRCTRGRSGCTRRAGGGGRSGWAGVGRPRRPA